MDAVLIANRGEVAIRIAGPDPRDSRALLCDRVRDAYEILPEYLGRPGFGARP